MKVKLTFICIGKKAKTGPKTMNFRLKNFTEPVQLISSGKNIIFAEQNLLAFKKTPLFSIKCYGGLSGGPPSKKHGFGKFPPISDLSVLVPSNVALPILRNINIFQVHLFFSS